MPFVIDASVALAWFFPDERPEYSARVLLRMKTESAFAPGIWPYEVANALSNGERRDRLRPLDVSRIADEVSRLPVSIHEASTTRIMLQILDLARQQALTVYDAAYLELAMRERLPLATLDEGLRAAAERIGAPLVA